MLPMFQRWWRLQRHLKEMKKAKSVQQQVTDKWAELLAHYNARMADIIKVQALWRGRQVQSY